MHSGVDFAICLTAFKNRPQANADTAVKKLNDDVLSPLCIKQATAALYFRVEADNLRAFHDEGD